MLVWSPVWAKATIGVAIDAGAMQFTRIPERHSSAAAFLVSPTTACLAAA